jgi:hypothetical protein
VLLCSLADDGIWLRAVLSDGAIVREAHFPDADFRPGPVEYDPVEQRLFLWDDGAAVLWVIDAGGEVRSYDAAGAAVGQIYDAQMFEGALYLASDTAVWRWAAGAGALERLATTTIFHALRGVFPSSQAGSLSVIDLGSDDAPDLYRIDPESAGSVLVYQNFDTEPGRVVRGFSGPEQQPHVCSGVGAIYSVADLQGGDHAPLVFPDQDALAAEYEGIEIATETTDCAWDAGTGRFLIHSRAVGVLVLDAWGHFEVVARPQGGEEFIRGSFFLPAVESE